MPLIHPLAIVSSGAILGENVEVGPFSLIGEGVEIGDGTRIASRVTIHPGTKLGKDNVISEGVVLGGRPQHLAVHGEVGSLVIGDGNTIRENSTLHLGMAPGKATQVGDRNLIMVNVHVAHDCQVGNHTIIVNNVMLAGHVSVDDRAYVSGAVAVHQFCRIGRFAMVGGQAALTRDVPPYVTVHGATTSIVGLNLVGLKRNGFTAAQIAELKRAYRLIYRSGLPWTEMLAQLNAEFTAEPVAEFTRFFAQSKRGFIPERRARISPLRIAEPGDDSDSSRDLLRKVG